MPMRVKGLAQLRRDLQTLDAKVGVAVFNDGTKAMAEEVAKAAKATTAFVDRTGALRRSITVGERPFRFKFYRRTATVPGGVGVVAAGSKGTGAPYAAAIEYGRKKASPRIERPFLREAVNTAAKSADREGYLAMKAAFKRHFGDGGQR